MLATERPVPLRSRSDLVQVRHRYQGTPLWIVKDPVRLQYFHLRDEEQAILEWLDGRASLLEIKGRFEARFSPAELDPAEIQQFAYSLHQHGLAISTAGGQESEMSRRRTERRERWWRSLPAELLCLRLRGVNPDWLLRRLEPLVGWFFSPAAVAATVASALAALVLVIVEQDVFRSRLPERSEFLSPLNLLALAATMSAVKVLHELGHALACRRLGGECPEIGVMILALSPCLYCNVSDACLFSSKWRRAAVAAAGMHVELALASLATFVWWFSEPGLLRQMCLSMMAVCSIGTLVFNGNPLLRYDGYHILADLLEAPNLRQSAGRIVWRRLSQWILGVELPDDPYLPRRHHGLYALYAVCSEVYRWIVAGAAAWFLSRFLHPLRLDSLGQLLAAVFVLGLIAEPAINLARFTVRPDVLDEVNLQRILKWGIGLAALVVFAVYVPLPCRVHGSLEILPRDAATVYVSMPGVLSEVFVREGESVSAGQPLARLQDLDVDCEVEQARAERDHCQAKLDSASQLRYSDPSLAEQFPVLEDALAAAEEHLQSCEEKRSRLLLTAPQAGIVLPPEERPRADPASDILPEWSGHPLAEINRGCFLAEKTALCHIGRSQQFWAELTVGQAEGAWLREGQRVEMRLDHDPCSLLSGTIVEISGDLSPDGFLAKAVCGQMSAATSLSRADGTSQRPSVYRARVTLTNVSESLRPGYHGLARVHVARRTLWQRVRSLWCQTFQFGLREP